MLEQHETQSRSVRPAGGQRSTRNMCGSGCRASPRRVFLRGRRRSRFSLSALVTSGGLVHSRLVIDVASPFDRIAVDAPIRRCGGRSNEIEGSGIWGISSAGWSRETAPSARRSVFRQLFLKIAALLQEQADGVVGGIGCARARDSLGGGWAETCRPCGTLPE